MKKSRWILVAEDDAPIAELTALALSSEELGCEVIVAHDGLEALDCLHHRGKFRMRDFGDPVLVLLDMKMPRVDGTEVLREIKSDSRFKYLPVVMFTSSRELDDLHRCYQLGANGFVVKPVEYQKYTETLECLGKFWIIVNELPPPDTGGEPGVLAPPQLAAA